MVVDWQGVCKQIVNQLAFDWFISDPANRPLPSIEGSDRLADTEMNSVKSSQLALINWFISDLANHTLPSIEGSDRLAPKKDEAVL